MTCIAWDGKTLAADKRAESAGHYFTTTKARKIATGEVLAWTGDADTGRMMAAWYEAGADPAKYPECQKDKDAWARLIVATARGVKYYDRWPQFTVVEEPFAAWGSGRDFALTAMHLGKSAREAVLIAALFESGCGNGVDEFQLCPA